MQADNTSAPEQIAQLEQALASAEVIENSEEPPATVAFGTMVTIRDDAGDLKTFTIVGVDEMELYDHAASWVSPIGKALLGCELGQRVSLEPGQRPVTILKIEYPETEH